MGILAPSNAFLSDQQYKTFTILQNRSADTLDVETASGDGLPYVRTDAAFAGTHVYTEVSGGKLQQEQYAAWGDTNGQDDAVALDDTTGWTDTGGGEAALAYVLGVVSTPAYYEGVSVFESVPYSLGQMVHVNSDLMTLTRTVPVNTTLTVQLALSKDGGNTWEAWTTITDGQPSGLLPMRADVRQYVVKYRVTITNSAGANAYMTQYKHQINSLVLYRMDAGGVMRTYNGTTGALSPISI